MKIIFKLTLLFLSIICCTTNSFAQDWYEMMYQEPVNIELIKQKAEKHFDKIGRGKHTGYKQYERWLYNATLNMDKNGVPYTRSHEAKELKKFRVNRSKRQQKTAGLNSKAGVDGDWTPMGPFYPKGNNDSKRLGRIPVIAIEPIDQQLLFAGSHGGGLWKSTDAGESWIPLGDSFDNMFITAVAIDPHNINHIIYMNDNSEVFESLDQGNTWVQVANFNQNITNSSRTIKFHPTIQNVYYVTGRDLFKTTDGGITFERVLEEDVEDILFKPGDLTTMYAAGDDFWKSTDTGETWTKITNGISSSERMKITVTPADPNRVYIVQVQGFGFGRIYKSTDSGDSFEIMADINEGAFNFGGELARRCLTIMCSTTDPDKLYMAGLLHFRSDDGGVTIYEVPDSQNSGGIAYIHADVIVMENINGTLYAASDGGIYRSTDGGINYIALAGNGLMVTQFHKFGSSAPYSGTGEGADPDLLVGGAQDNGTKIAKGTDHDWENWLGSDGMECFIDYTNDNIIYGSRQHGLLSRTEDRGETSDLLNRPESDGAFVTPFKMDPISPTTLYVGYNDLYRSTNAGESWKMMTSGQTDGENIHAIGIAPSDNNYMYFSHRDRLWVSTNAQSSSITWREVSGTEGGINYITIDPNNPLHALVAAIGSRVYETKDAGVTWVNITGNLPEISVESVLIDNSAENRMYVGMKQGVYYKDDTMTDWEICGNGLPRCEVRELEINHQANKLRVATYGRGIWEIPVFNTGESCGTPTGSSVTDISNTNATLNWDSVAGASSYDVRFSDTSLGNWTTYTVTSPSRVMSDLSTDDTEYEFQVRANCDGQLSRYATSVKFGTNTTITYCDSQGESVEDEWIDRVQFGSIDNSSGVNGGYGDFSTSHSTTIAAGSSATITITPAWSDEAFPEGYSVWIDLNKDGDFSDAGEQVFTQDVTTDTSVSGIITIPEGTPLVTTVMRVSMRFQAVPEPCGSFGFGEVEDYTVVIDDTSVICSTPTSLNVTDISNTNATLNWASVVSASGYDVRFRATSSSIWTTDTVTSTSKEISDLSTDDTEYEFQVRTNCGDATSEYTASVKFGDTPIIYCDSQGEDVSDEWIGRVQFGSIDNISGVNDGYGNFRATHTTTIAAGSSETITITPAWSGEVFPEGYSVWIDLNSNGDFSDAGEQVFFTEITTTNTPVSGTITIPEGISPMTTTMRVSMGFDSVPEPCGSFGFGEVEDYTVIINGTGISCGTPTGLNVTDISNTNATLNWASVTGASSYDVRFRATSLSSWTTNTVTSTSRVMSDLSTDDTEYEFQVRANCDGESSEYTTSVKFGTNITIAYCDSQGEVVSNEWIDRVQFGLIDNTSGVNGGYGNFSATHSTTIVAGSSEIITITPAWSGEAFAEGYSVWIDLNKDGDFSDVGEQVFTQDVTTDTSVSGTITIPEGTLSITTVMRVSMAIQAVPESCGSLNFGEVEDYAVNLLASNYKELDYILYPNPTTRYLNLDQDFSKGLFITIIDVKGQVIKQKVVSYTNQIDVSTLTSGVYFLKVNDEQKVKTHRFIKR